MWEKHVQQRMRMVRSMGARWKSGRTVCVPSSGVSRIHVEQELSAATAPLSKSVRSHHGVHCHQIQSQPSQLLTPSLASYDSYWYRSQYKLIHWPYTCTMVIDTNPKCSITAINPWLAFHNSSYLLASYDSYLYRLPLQIPSPPFQPFICLR